MKALSPPAPAQQMSIAFESIRLLGLSASERIKAVGHLAHLLMLAAGVASRESNDER
jgi:hypothetical protein